MVSVQDKMLHALLRLRRYPLRLRGAERAQGRHEESGEWHECLLKSIQISQLSDGCYLTT